MTNFEALPDTIDSIVEVSLEKRGVYDRHGDIYRLTPGGKKLNSVKLALCEGFGIEHSPLFRVHKPSEVGLRDWSSTLSAATPIERRALMRLAAAGKIIVK